MRLVASSCMAQLRNTDALADAILLSYMSSGLDMDPTERSAAGTAAAYNANVVRALEMLFDGVQPKGTLR